MPVLLTLAGRFRVAQPTGARMPSLQILKGNNEGSSLQLDGDRFVMGRNPDCAVVIPITSVSREHAQILRVQGKFFIEDKQSRNGTFVNNQAITSRTQLKHNDKIRICDFMAVFVDEATVTPAASSTDDLDEYTDADGTTSTVEASLSATGGLLLETQPAEKLRGLLEISANLSKTLELGQLLPKIADSLFLLFRQADRCFLIQSEEGNLNKLMPRVVKTRRPQDEANARFSKSIVRRCLETAQAFLSDDATKDDRVQLSQSVVDFKIRSVMCVPLCTAEGKAFGVIQLDTQDRSKKFTQDDLKLLWGVSNQASIALENARLLEDVVRQEKIKRDLELAHQVQLSFLPKSLPVVTDYQFGAFYQPALDVGGDYYGFIPTADGKLVAAVGDVAGKGIPAALLMAKLSSDTRFSVLTESDPGKAVTKLNNLLYEFTSQADRFVSLALSRRRPCLAHRDHCKRRPQFTVAVPSRRAFERGHRPTRNRSVTWDHGGLSVRCHECFSRARRHPASLHGRRNRCCGRKECAVYAQGRSSRGGRCRGVWPAAID